MVEQNKPRHDDYLVDLLLAAAMAAVFTICFFKTFCLILVHSVFENH